MKVVPLVLVALLMASPLAIAALESLGVGPAFEADPPAWESGYTWTWDVTGRGRAVGEGFGLLRYESDLLRVDATRRAEVLNTTTEQDGRPLDLLLEAFRVDRVHHGSKVVYDGTEGDPVAPEEAGFADTFFCITPCGTFLAPYDDDGNPTVGTHGLPLFDSDTVRLFDFPLTRGKTWTLMSVQDDAFDLEIEATAVDNEYVNIPGFAPMPAVRIEAAVTESSKSAIRDLVRQEAEQEGFQVELDFDLRATYWYAPQVQNLIKLDLDGFLLGHASGYGAAGSGRVDFHLDQVLRAYTLDARPERTLEEAHALVGAPQATPTAVATRPGPFDFQVGASQLSVAAGADSPVRFGLITGDARSDADDTAQTHFDTPPRGATVRWTHEAPTADGTVTTTEEGDGVAFLFDHPGLHVIQAEVYDREGRLVGSDQVVVEAYTHVTTTLDAGPSIPGTYHSLHDLYIAPGARSGIVTLATDGPARGTLLIGSDSGTDQAPVDTVGGPVQVTIGDLASGGRSIDWEDELRVSALSVTTEIRYDRSAAGTAAAAPDPETEPGPWSLVDLLGLGS